MSLVQPLKFKELSNLVVLFSVVVESEVSEWLIIFYFLIYSVTIYVWLSFASKCPSSDFQFVVLDYRYALLLHCWFHISFKNQTGHFIYKSQLLCVSHAMSLATICFALYSSHATFLA